MRGLSNVMCVLYVFTVLFFTFTHAIAQILKDDGAFMKKWPSTALDLLQQNSMYPECQDLYARYCSSFTPERCYTSKNRELCCATCEMYKNSLGVAKSELSPMDSDCSYGDRAPAQNCTLMNSNLCYDSRYRHQCCATCAKQRTSMKDCRYGDLDVSVCSAVKAHHCYPSKGLNTAEACCGTCYKYYTGKKDCEFGDHVQFYRMGHRWYSCGAYIAHFGSGKCGMPWEELFSHSCCGSCNNAKNLYKSNDINRFG